MMLVIASLAANALGAMLGMASGIFLVPLLTMAFGVPIQAAIGASLVAVVGCSCAAAAPALRAGLTNLRLAIVLEISAIAFLRARERRSAVLATVVIAVLAIGLLLG